MTVTNLNTVRSIDDEPMAEQSMPQGELGWEGHVHVSDDLPPPWPRSSTGRFPSWGIWG